ncbi:hypothetical protein ACG2F4_10720 [Halalkalibaculum sp. DA3122]|uniref:hypothetical protein n=1 Tax=Halalkalibaculum sp. DA384 TaxID=3373606 RepID=UPI0037552610
MELQYTDSSTWTVTLQLHEFETLLVAAKKLLQGSDKRIPKPARKRLKNIVNSYDEECKRVYDASKLFSRADQ